MARRGELETVKVGRVNMYNLDKYLREHGINKPKQNVCYCRVSSFHQKEDLERQTAQMVAAYPNYTLISDIGSGLNFNREGLKKVIDLAIKGELGELVIAYRDRLTRFGYDLIENIITKYSCGKITVLNKDEEKTPSEEMTEDLLAIMNVYVAKMNGMRKYKKK